MVELQRTPLYQKHLALKGDLVEYGGWLMPVQYEGIITEVRQTRRKAGLFDTSHMGEFLVEGPGAAEFLQEILTNDLSNLDDGRVIYSPACYPHGGTVDDPLFISTMPRNTCSWSTRPIRRKIMPGSAKN